jgi:hypothetical protein
MKTKVCRNPVCGRETPRGALYCCATCFKVYSDLQQRTREELVAAGFTQHGETPNVFEKDGVLVSLEQVMKHGIDEAYEKAAHAIQSE